LADRELDIERGVIMRDAKRGTDCCHEGTVSLHTSPIDAAEQYQHRRFDQVAVEMVEMVEMVRNVRCDVKENVHIGVRTNKLAGGEMLSSHWQKPKCSSPRRLDC
jgi:hypothetical protein